MLLMQYKNRQRMSLQLFNEDISTAHNVECGIRWEDYHE
jgi:hypothetical protein